MKRFGSAAWNGGLRDGKGGLDRKPRAATLSLHVLQPLR